MKTMLQHPEITWIERTGYPSWMQEPEEDEDDEETLDEEPLWEED